MASGSPGAYAPRWTPPTSCRPVDSWQVGVRTVHQRDGAKTPVLGCECGEWGCWPLMARIAMTAELVIWDSFEQPHRKTRDYTAFGPFRFDRNQYDDDD